MKLTRVDLTELILSENEGMQLCEFLRAVNGRKKLVNYIIKEAMRLILTLQSALCDFLTL